MMGIMMLNEFEARSYGGQESTSSFLSSNRYPVALSLAPGFPHPFGQPFPCRCRHQIQTVKDRTSGCERRDFSRSCRVFAGLKRGKEMSLYIY